MLTEQQRVVVDADGNFLLLACPGSGKTRSAAERVARLAGPRGTKVAVCSYTNVGADRISTVLARDLGVLLGPEHFLGTIHGFLLRYVVYPFAHLLGAERGPHVRADGAWPDVVVHRDNRQRITLDCFRRDPSGLLVITSKPRGVSGSVEQILASVGTQVARRKDGLFRAAGVLTADDAMWIALRILREHPEVAAAIAGRFDELLLDEAQDTSELQLACLAELALTGMLASLVLIGDLEQSIYSFQGASAEGCKQLAEGSGLRVISLTENHRCSQKICDVATVFREGSQPDAAVGPDATCEIFPEVVLYRKDDPAATMPLFRQRLAHHGIAPEQAVVLTRGWKIANVLNGQSTTAAVRERSWRIGQVAARLAAGTLGASDVRETRRMLAYCAWGVNNPDELTEEQQDELRRASYRFLDMLPPLEGDLRSWIRATAKVLQAVGVSLKPHVAHTGGRLLQAGEALAAHDAAEVFARAPRDLRAQTIHSFKGEDSEAVMVVVRGAHASDPASQLALWEAAVGVGEADTQAQEERRVLFVALTRARRYCLVALPDDARGRKVAAACAGLGFELVRHD